MKERIKQVRDTSFKRFEYVLLTVCLCVLAIRAMYVESPHGGLMDPKQILTNEALSLILSSTLILTTAAWFFVAFCRRKVSYRFSGIEIGAGLFLAAGLVGVFVASNKRAAITDMLTILAPMLTAILLIQILRSSPRIILVLLVAFALAATATYQCTDQFFSSNEDMIADYKQNPQKHLDVIGAEQGSFEQMLYEHRLYGKDIRGFLTTSNSTGSFLLLSAFAAIGLFVDAFRNRRDKSSHAAVVCLGLAAALACAGLILCRSKGALAAGAVCGVMFVTALTLGRHLHRRRRLLLVLIIVAVATATFVVIGYGTSHGTLPGGASMLVRWQYWDGAARMYADKPLTGVGGGNFANYYPHYKIPAAPETVADPHNFILSLLSQYGPLGAIGFVAGFVIILLRVAFRRPAEDPSPPKIEGASPNTRPLITVLFISVILLILRPVFVTGELGDRPDVRIYVYGILFVAPATVFAAWYSILWASPGKITPPAIIQAVLRCTIAAAVFFFLACMVVFWPSAVGIHGTLIACLAAYVMWAEQKYRARTALKPGWATQIGLFCGIVAVAIHNLIDFAIFEPAVAGLFWTMTACLFAVNSQRTGAGRVQFAPPKIARLAVLTTTAVLIFALLHWALIPPVRSGRNIQRALNDPYCRIELFDAAAKADPLSPRPLSLSAKACLQQYARGDTGDKTLLQIGADQQRSAIQRNKAGYKNYRKLAEVYELQAETAASQSNRLEDLQQAFDALTEAARRYPGSDRIHLKLARLAELLNRDDEAIAHYKTVVQIEDAYRDQFKIMYPDRELFSRLGEKNYQLAKKRLAELKY